MSSSPSVPQSSKDGTASIAEIAGRRGIATLRTCGRGCELEKAAGHGEGCCVLFSAGADRRAAPALRVGPGYQRLVPRPTLREGRRWSRQMQWILTRWCSARQSQLLLAYRSSLTLRSALSIWLRSTLKKRPSKSPTFDQTPQNSHCSTSNPHSPRQPHYGARSGMIRPGLHSRAKRRLPIQPASYHGEHLLYGNVSPGSPGNGARTCIE